MIERASTVMLPNLVASMTGFMSLSSSSPQIATAHVILPRLKDNGLCRTLDEGGSFSVQNAPEINRKTSIAVLPRTNVLMSVRCGLIAG